MKKFLLLFLLIAKTAFAVTATDNFNRANEDPLSGGGSWLQEFDISNTNLRIVSNSVQLSNVGNSCFYYNGISPGADQFSEVKLSTVTSNGFNGVALLVRAVTGTGGTYMARVYFNNGSFYSQDFLVYTTSSGYTVLDTGFASWAQGDTAKFVVSGTTNPVLSLYQNGSLVETYTDTSGTLTFGKPGVCLAADTNTADIQVDDWRGGDGDGTTTPPAAVVRHKPIIQ